MDHTSLVFSPLMREFLQSRSNAQGDDAPVASAWLTWEPSGDDEEQSFFDIKMAEAGPRITYTTKARWAKAGDDDPFAPKGFRVAARPASVAQRVTKIEQGRALDAFTQSLRAFLVPPPKVEIVSGPIIAHHYSHENNCHGCASSGGDTVRLRTSCMNPPEYARAGRFQIYVDRAELAIIVCPECEKIRARTIIWTDEFSGVKRHSEIYSNDADRGAIAHHLGTLGIRRLHGYWDGPREAERITVAYRANLDNFPSLDGMGMLCQTCRTVSNLRCLRNPHQPLDEERGIVWPDMP